MRSLLLLHVAFLGGLGRPAFVSAADYPVANFYNYYVNEGAGRADWANNCRVSASGSVSTGKVTLSLGFKFDWNPVPDLYNGDYRNDRSTFAAYSSGSSFDLVIASGGSPAVWNYAQSNSVRPQVVNNGGSPGSASASVTFKPLVLSGGVPGTTTTVPFEVYGDCDACGANEANPKAAQPPSAVTTWRVYGAINIVVDSSGNITWSISGVGSENPQKAFKSGDSNHPASWFPQRKLARRSSFGSQCLSGGEVYYCGPCSSVYLGGCHCRTTPPQIRVPCRRRCCRRCR